MKILIDMNLSPDWVRTLVAAGFEATHWMNVGDPRATDRAILRWARDNGYDVVFTHDLDFGTFLAASGDDGPSVVQLRAQDTLPDAVGSILVAALRQFEEQLIAGALVVVEPRRSRARILPIRKP